MLSCLNKENYYCCYHYHKYDIAIVTYFFVRLFSIFVFLLINKQPHSYPSGPHGSPFFVGFVLPILFFLFFLSQYCLVCSMSSVSFHFPCVVLVQTNNGITYSCITSEFTPGLHKGFVLLDL